MIENFVNWFVFRRNKSRIVIVALHFNYISTPKLSNESYCVSDTELNCMLIFSSYFKSINTNKYCGKACPAKCSSIKYILKQMSRAHFTNPNYIRKLLSFDTTKKLLPHYYYFDSITSHNGIVRNITDLQLMQNYDQWFLVSHRD